MRPLLLYLFLLIFPILRAQNLIPNGGFEDLKKCPKALGQLDRCTAWTSPNTGTPDYFHACYTKDAQTIGVPNNYFGTRAAYEGQAYAGILCGTQEKEYLQIALSEPLVAGRRYCLRFRAAVPSPNSDGRSAIRVAMVASTLALDNWNTLEIPEDDLLDTHWEALEGNTNWAMFGTTFIAKGGESALIVGYFQALEFRAYTYLDAFELSETTSEFGCAQLEFTEEDEDKYNLIPNPGFERKFGCPSAREDLAMAMGWQVAENTPDFYHVCGTGTAAVPINELGQQNPHTGNGYGGMWTMLQERVNYREFVKTRLQQPLEAGRKYCLSIWVSLAEESDHALDELQLRITQPGDNSSCQVGVDTTELVTLRNGHLLANRKDWVFLHGTFIAKGGEQMVMIGNFRGNDDPHMQELHDQVPKPGQSTMCSYYYIDDIGLHAVGGPTCSCPDDNPPPIPTTEPEFQAGDTLVLRNLKFAFDKADILPSSFPQLDSLADFLSLHPDLKIRITGHTDSDGEAAYNQKLSESRAASVLAYLARRGIAASRMRSAGLGEAQPSSSNATDLGKAMNRRVEVEFLGE